MKLLTCGFSIELQIHYSEDMHFQMGSEKSTIIAQGSVPDRDMIMEHENMIKLRR